MIRRALFTVSDKTGVGEFAKTLHESGTEIVATGRTAKVIEEAGVPVVPIEKVSGSPEAFRGRMKTLSFPVCSGILYRRNDAQDESDLQKLEIPSIDCVVVNFYPFEEAAKKEGITRSELIEEIDIGGPTLVRAAAKNAPDVLVLTDPKDYPTVMEEVRQTGKFSPETALRTSQKAWQRIADYDEAIRDTLVSKSMALRYGENPHQEGQLVLDEGAPIRWDKPLTEVAYSYNNILDLSSAYDLMCDLNSAFPDRESVVIIKHNNPCGVASVPEGTQSAQLVALQKAWDGDPVSSFGGVLLFNRPLRLETANWLKERFVELVGAPGLSKDDDSLQTMLMKRKKLKAVEVEHFNGGSDQMHVSVPGGKLVQTVDRVGREEFQSVTKKDFTSARFDLAHFGTAVCRSLKSNSIAFVREMKECPNGFQLVGAGQGQPNRVEALKHLALPRAQATLEAASKLTDQTISDCVMVSDAFFPFRDTVDISAEAGVRWIVQPGGSMKDKDSIDACDEAGVAMAFTGRRHFKH